MQILNKINLCRYDKSMLHVAFLIFIINNSHRVYHSNVAILL